MDTSLSCIMYCVNMELSNKLSICHILPQIVGSDASKKGPDQPLPARQPGQIGTAKINDCVRPNSIIPRQSRGKLCDCFAINSLRGPRRTILKISIKFSVIFMQEGAIIAASSAAKLE